jgi:hypothetical protein
MQIPVKVAQFSMTVNKQQLTLWQFSGLVLSGVLLMIISSSGALETL